MKISQIKKNRSMKLARECNHSQIVVSSSDCDDIVMIARSEAVIENLNMVKEELCVEELGAKGREWIDRVIKGHEKIINKLNI